jgi:S1-C subfamily serine protease
VNALDFIIVLFVFFLAWRGAHTGFLAGALSLAGVVSGAAVGSRLAPALLGDDVDLIFGSTITLASIVAFAVLGEVLARSLGGFLREKLVNPASEALDRVGGAILGSALSLTLVWMAANFALGVPPLSSLQPTIHESRVLRVLNEGMPSQLLTQAVSSLDPIPNFRGPEPDVAEPTAELVNNPDVLAAASRVVRVTGVACGFGIEATGWVAASDLIVTNAHVVAGQISTGVQPEGMGVPLPARVVVFDQKNDLAVLRVNNLRLPPLSFAEPDEGESVAILGFPDNGPFSIRAGRTGNTQRVISNDAYNRGPVERTVTSFKGFVRPGNSGGPAVNAEGAVVATVFASRADSENSGYGVPSAIGRQLVDLAKERHNPVDTKECAT